MAAVRPLAVLPVAAGVALLLGVSLWVASVQSASLSPGQSLYATYCASCHGVKLEGQPNWMQRNANGRLPAPPHDVSGHTWHHSDAQLLTIVREGLAKIAPGYETDMPAFGDRLSDAEIRAILDYIKNTWPERQREFQQQRSLTPPS